MSFRSISFRLTAFYAGTVVLVILVFASYAYHRLEHYLLVSLKESMSHRVTQIAGELANDSEYSSDRIGRYIQALYAPELNDRFIRVSHTDGSIIYISGEPNDRSFVPERLPLPKGSPSEGSVRLADLPPGVVIASVVLNFKGATYIVEAGASKLPIKNALSGFLKTLIIGLPIVVGLTVWAGFVLIKRALAPVQEITKTAREITQHHLSRRLPVARTGDEIESLSVTLNQMISRLQISFESVNRFTADASHELRTPLTIIRGELEGLLSNEDLPQAIRETVLSLLEETERLGKVVQGLLVLSRLDGGRALSERVRFDLSELVFTTAEQVEPLASENGINLTSDIQERIDIEGDRARLKQVIVNLLDNAIKYTLPGGSIVAAVKAAHGKAILEVLDTGIGIAEGDLEHVFERFFRAERLGVDAIEGTGLGLPIVRSICSAHGGTVKAFIREGGGSRFTVELPLAV